MFLVRRTDKIRRVSGTCSCLCMYMYSCFTIYNCVNVYCANVAMYSVVYVAYECSTEAKKEIQRYFGCYIIYLLPRHTGFARRI